MGVLPPQPATAAEQGAPDLEVLGSAQDVPSGIDLIRKVRPDILFLDMDLGGQTGFDLLRALGEDKPHILIFTTAHESYAVKAIRFSALDYLLKPIDRAELDIAVERARGVDQGGGPTRCTRCC